MNDPRLIRRKLPEVGLALAVSRKGVDYLAQSVKDMVEGQHKAGKLGALADHDMTPEGGTSTLYLLAPEIVEAMARINSFEIRVNFEARALIRSVPDTRTLESLL